jgi:hypothetical protein
MPKLPEGEHQQAHRKISNLIGPLQEPVSEVWEAFITSDNPEKQRRIFADIRSFDTETRKIYFEAAGRLVTSDKLTLAAKKKILESLAAFLGFAEEGLCEYAPESLGIRDSAYHEVLDFFADYLESADIGKDEYREIFKCLTEMDYFRVKRTLMLSYVEYTYPHDAGWFTKRLKLCITALEKGDDFVAWNVLAFLSPTNGYRVLENLLNDSGIEKGQIALLEDLLSILDTVVPRWLQSSDYRVVTFACLYCNIRRLVDTLPLLEQIQNSEGKLVKEIVAATIKKFKESE